MGKLYRKGAVGALLDENCRSIQTILTHVVSSGYGYAVYIQNSRGVNSIRPEKRSNPTVQDYIKDLEEMFRFTINVFENIGDDELEQGDDSHKIQTGWGQRYDIEQLMEHAIVHVLRHRRQIEKFNLAIR